MRSWSASELPGTDVAVMEPSLVQDIRRHLDVLRKRRVLVAACLGLALLAAAVCNHATRPIYRATAQILILPAAPKVLPGKDPLDSGLQDHQTEYLLLAGRNLAEKLVERLPLQTQAELAAGPLINPWERLLRAFRDEISAAPAGDPAPEQEPLSPAAAAVRSRLQVEPLPGGRLVDVHFHAYDPSLAAQAANTLVQLYIEQSILFRRHSSSEATDWLSDRVLEQRKRLEQAEQALLAYQERLGPAILDESGAADGDDAARFEEAAAAARMERTARESLLGQVRALPSDQLATVPVLMAGATVQQLSSRITDLQAEQARLASSLGERHPDMVRLEAEIAAAGKKLQGELLKAVRSLQREAQVARAREARLEADLGRAREKGLEGSRRAIEYRALRREVESQRQVFQALMSRSKETGLESELKATGIRIVETAQVPRSPAWPRKARNYRMALLAGLVVAIGLALLLEHADDTVKTPDDIKRLDLPFLGLVPSVAHAHAGPALVRHGPLKNPEKVLAEAYRILRTNLLFSAHSGTGHAILVTSPNPGEGKTTTAVNLATALALNGSRVLVVDADLRRPTLHKHLRLPRTPGLSDLIVTKCRASQAIHPTRLPGLQALPSGHSPSNPVELLGSAGLAQILDAFRSHYDWVVVDTPPVLSMADTAVLCRSVDGVVLVVAAEHSSRSDVRRTIEQIASVGGTIVGAVLQRVDLARNFYYYGRYYKEYYRSDDAEGSDASAYRVS